MTDFASAFQDLAGASHSGCAFLLAFGSTWLLCGFVALRFSQRAAALCVIFQGVVALPLAFLLQHLLGFPPAAPDNPLTPLAILLAVSQSLAIPAVLIAYRYARLYVPAAFGAILGAHFLPYAWLQQSRLYLGLAVAVAWTPLVLTRLLGERGFRLVPWFIGACLVLAAGVLY